MPRTARASVGGVCYHVLNRGNAKAEVFHTGADYRAFQKLLGEGRERVPMRLLAYCLMPNHFHLVLWPLGDGDLGRWMQWVMTSHVRRYHSHYGTSGHIWQGRFKAFPIQSDGHLLSVCRYVERNPVRAGLVESADEWPCSSIAAAPFREVPLLDALPVRRPADWLEYVNKAISHEEVEAVRQSIKRGAPFGHATWVRDIARRLGLESALRPRGRPRKQRGHSTFSADEVR